MPTPLGLVFYLRRCQFSTTNSRCNSLDPFRVHSSFGICLLVSACAALIPPFRAYNRCTECSILERMNFGQIKQRPPTPYYIGKEFVCDLSMLRVCVRFYHIWLFPVAAWPHNSVIHPVGIPRPSKRPSIKPTPVCMNELGSSSLQSRSKAEMQLRLGAKTIGSMWQNCQYIVDLWDQRGFRE